MIQQRLASNEAVSRRFLYLSIRKRRKTSKNVLHESRLQNLYLMQTALFNHEEIFSVKILRAR